MRVALAIALMVAGSRVHAAPPDAERVHITLGSDALGTARAVSGQVDAHLEVLGQSGPVAIAAVDAEDLDALSHAMHEHHDRCGGFMVHDSFEDAQAALIPTRSAAPPDYTLDRAPQVTAALAILDRERIANTIRELSAMRNRYYRSEHGAAASTWLRDRWMGFSNRPDLTFELVDHGYAQRSVVMTLRGSTRADEIVVIGGHLDSIAIGGSSANAPGADDDASGIATLTEIARVLLAKNYRPERTLKFMAYAAEEVGLRGSLSIAKAYRERGINVVGVLQLDMTNYRGSDRDIWLIDDFTNKPQNRFLAALIETYTDATWGSDVCGYACSDHAAWTRYGFAASMPFESRAHERNKKIHTARDTLETSGGNADHAVKFAALGLAYAIELGKGALALESPQPPRHASTVRNAPPRAPQTDGRRVLAISGAVLLLFAASRLTRRVQ
ncbi:MAG: M20/M25/M40 family metallo-hydrolase [Kofleriaceae bacterium]